MMTGIVVNNTHDLLLEYLRKIFYGVSDAELDISALDEDYAAFGKALVYFVQCFLEYDAFAKALATGDLNTTPPNRENALASSLKSLHANLKHLTWQTQQVAKGDYKQRVAYLGDFSDAFNLMIEQLAERQRLLEQAMLAEVRRAEQYADLMLNANPLCCQLWDMNHNVIDCNVASVKLFGFKNKQELLDRFYACLPEYQPDGQRTDIFVTKLLNKAFDEGYCFCELMHQKSDGTPLPMQVTLVRIDYKGDYIVSGYSKDMRTITNMVNKIVLLESEVDKSYYDALTGIYNRRFLDQNMYKVIKSLSRSGGTLSLMMIDIDCFKEYNDTYGHVEGDNCLKIVAGTLAKSIARADDFVVRYGGEEFAVVLPNTDGRSAQMIAEKLLVNIRRCNLLHENNSAANCVTVSIGATSGKASHAQSGEEYISLADKLLYQAKQSGRNRFMYAPLEATSP